MHIAAKHWALALVTASALLMGGAHAAGSADAGKAKSATCAACHGADGNSLNPEWPALAGQHAAYIITQLEWFRSGQRKNVLMSSQAVNLSDEDIKDLAAYFSSQPLKVPGAVEGTVEKGEKLYRGGNATTGLTACMGCHGPNGRGNPGALMPAVGGQHAAYTASALKNYRSGEREHPIMGAIAQRLTDAEIDALAGYLQGLH
ncbi:MAG: c-type cytochrome [Pseudomonadota bacterium]